MRRRRINAHLGAVFGIVLVLAAALLPVRGVALESGELVEICGELGVSLVRLDAEGNLIDAGAPCPECDRCLLCAAAADSVIAAIAVPQTAAGECKSALARAGQTSVDNPARFWAATRGPPNRNEKADFVHVTSFVAPAQACGRAPWT